MLWVRDVVVEKCDFLFELWQKDEGGNDFAMVDASALIHSRRNENSLASGDGLNVGSVIIGFSFNKRAS